MYKRISCFFSYVSLNVSHKIEGFDIGGVRSGFLFPGSIPKKIHLYPHFINSILP